MGSNRRQRRRYSNRYNDKTTKILIISVAVLVVALVISVAFNFSKNKSLPEVKTTELSSTNETDNNSENNNESDDVDDESSDEEKEVFGAEYRGPTNSYDFIGPRDGKVSFTITALGDILCHNDLYNDAYDSSTDSYNFSYIFDDIKYYTQTGSLTIGNLDTCFAGSDKGYNHSPVYNSPDALADSIKSLGVDVLTTANNHCLDTGYEGLERTINVLNSADVPHLGTYTSQEERDKVFIKYVKGVKIAVLDYTFGVNSASIPEDKKFCVNLIDKDLISSDIEKAKSASADVIIACMHWGDAYSTSVNDEQKDLSDFLFQKGVDVILGNHPECVEPFEKRVVTLEDGTQKDCFVAYALGDFIADSKEDITKNSIILNLEMTKNTNGTLSIDGANYVPIHMFKDDSVPSKKFKIINLDRVLRAYQSGVDLSLGKDNYEYLSKQLESIKAVVGDGF